MGDMLASYPGHVGGEKSGLVSTVCACAKTPMISWGFSRMHGYMGTRLGICVLLVHWNVCVCVLEDVCIR